MGIVVLTVPIANQHGYRDQTKPARNLLKEYSRVCMVSTKTLELLISNAINCNMNNLALLRAW